MRTLVIEGDIAMVEADALITAINSSGMWFGGIDRVISRSAGNQFHAQAANALEADPATKVVVAPMLTDHNGCYEDVVFTIDDLNEDLKVVVRRALDAAAEAGYEDVSMPAIRFGVMRSIGGTPEEKVQAIADALREHEAEAPTPLKSVTIVVYGDPSLATMLRKALT